MAIGNLLGLNSENHNYCEIEQEMHYMRRKLRPNELCRDAYTLVSTVYGTGNVRFLWSLDPQIRNDSVYAELVHLPGNLAAIPWARTGMSFGAKAGGVDPLSNSTISMEYG